MVIVPWGAAIFIQPVYASGDVRVISPSPVMSGHVIFQLDLVGVVLKSVVLHPRSSLATGGFVHSWAEHTLRVWAGIPIPAGIPSIVI